PDKSEIAEVLKKSISGNLSVSSTSGDTIITVDGKDLGKLPVTNFLISDGIHTLEFSKPGKTPIAKEVWLRAGETREIFQEWDDDYTLGALNVLSYPSGLKISWDDYLKGETPLFSNDMSPGNYKIEFSKQKQGEENTSYILDEEIVKVEAKKISTVAFPVKLLNGLDPANESIWVNAGEGGIYPQFGKELIFQKLSEPIPGWHGISTHPLISGSLDATITAYSQEEVGNGKMAITFFQNEKDNYTVELENSRISLYKFPSDGVSIANYEFKNNDPEKGRPVRFVTDKDKQQLKIYFGNKKVFETEESFHNLWRIALWIKSDSPPKSKTFRSFSITYPKIALPEK
ncbi:MAG: PEGA domain-containing protein, partial [Leptospiraceae bacterium]|nr:PEGA domain-containing protein [Leptospiraceae bacterium]